MTLAAVSRDLTQYVTIGIGHEIFAIDVTSVREILDMQPIARLPNAPLFLVGMTDVRGQGVPTVDLRVKLGLPTVPITQDTRILVLDIEIEGRPLTLGIIADRVIEVTSLDEHALEAPPQIGGRWRSSYIRAIGRSKGLFVIIFDLNQLFLNEETALLEHPEEAG
ncbi:MAG TPA: chemotaxis protein CheW [Candidatus Sulfotelmatobacter sp.]|jgi:purine-binding chemotaxis protein CheW|nr:chemotaxis protein CheW [Candidatus Sulfotelmatobacter sp.]